MFELVFETGYSLDLGLIHIMGFLDLGFVRVCEKFLHSKGSFFGTAVSFLFWHLKNLGEPYKDQKLVWP